MAAKFPGRLTIAEDLQNDPFLTKEEHEGGAGFGSQWDANFVHPIREAVILAADEHRSMQAVAGAIQFRYNIDSFERVIYSESHDEVANGKPDPEAYLKAAELLGVDIRRCVAVEDSPTGIASAIAAGANVIGVQRQVPVTARPGLSRLHNFDNISVDTFAAVASGVVVDELL